MNPEARLSAWIDKVVAAAPTFTDEQVADLRPFFQADEIRRPIRWRQPSNPVGDLSVKAAA